MELGPPSGPPGDGKTRELRGAAAPYSFETSLAGEAMGETWGPWFRLLVEHANDLIYLHRPDGEMLYVNRKLEEVLGWRREEVLGRNILDLVAPEYRAPATARRDAPFGQTDPHRYELEVVGCDGTRIPLEVHSTPVTVDGRTIAWQGIARDIRERRRAQARMAAIYESARQIVSMLDLDEVLAAIVNRAAAITGAQACSLWLVEGGRDMLYCAAPPDAPKEVRGERILAGAAHPIARAIHQGQGIIADVGSLDGPAPGLPRETVTAVCLPLEGSGGPIGVLSLSYARTYVPDPDEMALLSTFASHAAAAITNARLFEAQSRKTQEATAIGQIGMWVGSLDINAVLHIAGSYVYDLFRADTTGFLVIEGDRLRPAFMARGGQAVTDGSEPCARIADHPLCAEAVRREHPVLVEDTRLHPLTWNDEHVRQSGAITALVVPLMSREKALGVLLIAYQSRTLLSDVQVRLAETLAQQAAVAIENAVMFEAVASAKREWEATFDAITDPVCIFSPDGVLVRANVAAGKTLGAAVPAILGRHYADVLYGSETPEHGDVFQQCLALRRPITREVRNLGIPGVFQVAAYPLLDQEGTCTGIVEYIKDITAQTEMQARLYHSARLAGVGELAAGIVHNFKNVLMGVSGMLDVAGVLLDRGAAADDVRARLSDAQGHVFRGNQVLQRLLDFARGMPQEVAVVHMDVLLPDVVALCKVHPASRGIYIRTELPPDVPPIQADPNQLHEVLVNLVLNALQAMSGRGAVTIRAERQAEMLLITVSDTGCGIAPEAMERIFEPFYSRRQSGPAGTGIGLSASLRMVRSMGGDITVTSRVGEGSTFAVALPLASA